MNFDTLGDAPARATDLVDLACMRCALSASRTQVVPAEGVVSARLFLVGEAPGPDEDRQGRPFVGRAGRILRRCLEAAGVPSDNVWISNVVKCFPHSSVDGKRRIRKPAAAEADACRIWLAAEVSVVDAPLLVAVGATAAEHLTGRRGLKLTQVHGSTLPSRAEFGGRPVFLTFHPSGLHYGHATEEDLTRDLAAAYAQAMALAGDS